MGDNLRDRAAFPGLRMDGNVNTREQSLGLGTHRRVQAAIPLPGNLREKGKSAAKQMTSLQDGST